MARILCIALMFMFCTMHEVVGQVTSINQYNLTWNKQSKNSSESMPVGGGSIGANVWVENNDILLYAAQGNWFDENNQLLKAGRLRIHINPESFGENGFSQTLNLEKGHILIKGKNKGIETSVLVWIDVLNPNLHIDVSSNKSCTVSVSYETWRDQDRKLSSKERNSTSYKWVKGYDVQTTKDIVSYDDNSIIAFHQNPTNTIVDRLIEQQGLSTVKDSIQNPLRARISGSLLLGNDMHFQKMYRGTYANVPFQGYAFVTEKKKTHQFNLSLLSQQFSDRVQFSTALKKISEKSLSYTSIDKKETEKWWNEFWNRSNIISTASDSMVWKMIRNYHLFRYMLAANANGEYPTKFNGGLFSFDPIFTDTSIHGTPDYRTWGGGIFTAQNQRLVYWPMLKSGDADMMKPAFDFYNRLLKTAELRSKTYWGHAGASFTEQMENSGLPNFAEYGTKRPTDFDKGVEYNAWLEYEWDTALEFCMMILESASYSKEDIQSYIPLIKSCLQFFDEHYQYLAKKRGAKALNEKGELILYPSSAGETYKMAYNPSSVIAALKTVSTKLLSSGLTGKDDSIYLSSFYRRIPEIPLSNSFGKTTIAAAKIWERVNNVESMQLYPVFPWGIYGVGKPHLDIAINTYKLDTFVLKFRSYVGWKQDNIFAARLGLTEDAFRLNALKLKDGPYRFPAFWGPGYDWSPDHNWGGSGMIGLQEMLLQTADEKIILFPAWPREKNISFKLHAPMQTTVEAKLENGQIIQLDVQPASRKKDIIISWNHPR